MNPTDQTFPIKSRVRSRIGKWVKEAVDIRMYGPDLRDHHIISIFAARFFVSAFSAADIVCTNATVQLRKLFSVMNMTTHQIFALEYF